MDNSFFTPSACTSLSSFFYCFSNSAFCDFFCYFSSSLSCKSLCHFFSSLSYSNTCSFSCGIAYWLQIVGQRHLPPALASLLMSFEAMFGAFFGALLLHERMTSRELLGCGLIFVALVLSQVIPHKE